MKKISTKHQKPPIKKVAATKKEVKTASEKVMKKFSKAIKRLANR